MSKTSLGVFCIALSSLLLELNLIRIFDVLWYPNMAYMIITLAVFSFGLAGVYLALRPAELDDKTWRRLAFLGLAMAVWVLLMRPMIDRLPFDYNLLVGERAGEMTINFFLVYVVVCVPFFCAGLVLSMVFSHYARMIRQLYFWDLIGAALGCVLLIPLLPKIGASGVMYIVAGLSLISAFLFSQGKSKLLSTAIVAVALIAIVYPFTKSEIGSFKPHMNKRSFNSLVGQINEGTWWDPISKINVLDTASLGFNRKWVAYDGGTQSSYFYPFDGDFDKLRENIRTDFADHFWNIYVAASHFLKAGTNPKVLIIGSAGGQELKAALTYDASEVDAVELVGKVVELGKGEYSEYLGHIMNDPRANVVKGEGRSFLRSSGKTYDIIQMFSNHTSSSIAAGSGAMQPNYLQTVEAYKEYFTHLSENGVLHINHHVYPKMVATAARAWKELGRTDFRRHVLVSDVHGVQNNLPTLMIKMAPWSPDETNRVKSLLARFYFPVDPLRDSSFISDEFFSGELSQETLDKVPYRIEVPTDNKPFFNSLRTNLKTLPDEDHTIVVNHGISGLLNSQMKLGFPIDVAHLFVTAGAAIVFAFIFTLGPLLFAKTGRESWQGKKSFMAYFCALGLGFIVFELVFIQIFMKLIGFPLYTYTTVLFTFLFGAGVGSLMSDKLKLFEKGRYWVPFVGIAVSALLVGLAKLYLFDSLLALDTTGRVMSSVVMIFPLAFFLGMPFPMGIMAIEQKPVGTVAWAWALNGLFTVVGGVFCAIFAVYFGFIATLIVAVAAYALAWFTYRNMVGGITK